MSGNYMEAMLRHYGEKEIIEEKQRVIDLSFNHMVATIRENVTLPIVLGDTEVGTVDIGESNVKRIASKLIDEGYRLEQHSCWVTDDVCNQICNNCHGRALASPNAFGEIILSRYCPHCGSNMKG